MEVQIRINGVLLDGVAPGAVKLTINNPDPIKFSERTVSYSGSITVPRSQVNDRVLKSERFPGYYTRTSPYVAELSFSGLDAPIGGGLFRARVSADIDSYTVELIETIPKLSTVRAPLSYLGVFATGAYQYTRFKDLLVNAYPGTVTLPDVYRANGTTPLNLAYVSDQTEHLASDFVDRESQIGYFGSHDGLTGSVYPVNYMVTMSNELTAAFRFHTGTTFDLRFTDDSFVILPATAPTTIYLRSDNGGTFALPFTRGAVQPGGGYKYSPVNPGGTSCIITPNLNAIIRFGFTASASSMVYLGAPVTDMPVSESHYISFKIQTASNPSHKWSFAMGVGMETPFDIVMAYCKGFCWTYDFVSSPFSVTIKPFINPSTAAEYRQNWSGKIDSSTVNVTETAGAGRTYVVKIGELRQTVPGFLGAVSPSETAGESNFAVNPGASRPYVTPVYQSGTSWYPDNYFTRASGYRATILGHYSRFTPGWQVTAKMRLTYFDIKNMKSDALYYVDELGAWFYLRTISNWDASTGTANVTLIAVNN